MAAYSGVNSRFVMSATICSRSVGSSSRPRWIWRMSEAFGPSPSFSRSFSPSSAISRRDRASALSRRSISRFTSSGIRYLRGMAAPWLSKTKAGPTATPGLAAMPRFVST